MDKENFSRAPGNTEEVILRSPRSPKIPTTQNRSSSTALKNRILGVATLALAACSDGHQKNDGVEKVAQALVTGWEEPTLPNLGLTGAVNIAQVERSGSHIDLYVINAALSGNSDVIKVGSDDNGATWNSPSPTLIQGIDSPVAELDFKIQGTKAYIVSGKDGISTKLYSADWNGTSVSNMVPVSGIINDDFATVSGVAFNESGTKIFATSDLASPNSKLFMAEVGTWNWIPLDSCSTSNSDGIFVSGDNLFITSDRTPTMGGFDAMVFNGGWDDALNQCIGSADNLNNYTSGVVKFNDVNSQRNIYVDNLGDAWVGGYQLKWAKKKSGGAGGAAGSAGTAGQGGTGAGGAGMAGAGGAGQAGMAGQPGGTAGAGAEAGTAGTGGVAGQPGGTGGVSGQPGGTAGAGAEAGTAGAGGLAGQPGGSGGVSGQPGGSAGAGGSPEGGAGGAGQGGSGAGGTEVGGTGGSGQGGSGAGGTEAGGSGGSVSVSCDMIKVAENPQNIVVKTCENGNATAKFLGPVKFSIGTKNWDVYNIVKGSKAEFSWTSPSYPVFSAGIEKKTHETGESDKIVDDDQYGGWTGYEGTGVDDFIPGGALNPNKEKGIYNVVGKTLLEGAAVKYKKDNCNKTQIDKCQREDFLMEGAKQKGDLVVGKPLFTELSSGKQSDNPKDFEIQPQIVEKIPGDSDDGGICSISTVGNGAHHPFGLATIGFAAGLGILVARRRKGFIGVETNK